jgi:hypothetical protein
MNSFRTTKNNHGIHGTPRVDCRPQPNLCVTLTGLQIYAISPRAAPGLAARLTLGFYVSPSGLLPLRGCCGRGGLGGRCGRRLMCVVLAAQRASNIKAQGERSEALGEAYNNFEPRQG